MRKQFLEWFARHFDKIAITLGLLNLFMGNFVIGSLWILIALIEYQDKLDM
jgi:hypothetical protein